MDNFKPFDWPTWPIWDERDLKNLISCLEAKEWSRGRWIMEFEVAFANYCGSKYALLVNSGTEALTIALKAVGVEPGDEVILPGLTWPSTALAVLECGAKAIIVDIEKETYTISPERIINQITEKTKAIIAVHLFCSIADLTSLLSIVRNYNLSLIEDAAQAHGCEFDGKYIGTFGAVGAFSFHQKKLITCGEGGCLITDDENIYNQAYNLRDHGTEYKNQKATRYGGNSRISSFSASLLLAQLERLPEILAAEERAGALLYQELNRIPGIQCLARRKMVTRQTFCSFCFRLIDSRLRTSNNEIRKRLKSLLGFDFSKAYPPLDDKVFFKPSLEKRYDGLWLFSELSNCHLAHEESLRFPHQYLLSPQEEIYRIAETIRNVVSSYA